MGPTSVGAYKRRIAELEAALRDVLALWEAGTSAGRDPLVGAMDRAEIALRKTEPK